MVLLVEILAFSFCEIVSDPKALNRRGLYRDLHSESIILWALWIMLYEIVKAGTSETSEQTTTVRDNGGSD